MRVYSSINNGIRSVRLRFLNYSGYYTEYTIVELNPSSERVQGSRVQGVAVPQSKGFFMLQEKFFHVAVSDFKSIANLILLCLSDRRDHYRNLFSCDNCENCFVKK